MNDGADSPQPTGSGTTDAHETLSETFRGTAPQRMGPTVKQKGFKAFPTAYTIEFAKKNQPVP